jgi:hypothetical protein
MLIKVTGVEIASRVIGTGWLKGIVIKWTWGLGWLVLIVDISISWTQVILKLIL